jgi:hypothetical protein
MRRLVGAFSTDVIRLTGVPNNGKEEEKGKNHEESVGKKDQEKAE